MEARDVVEIIDETNLFPHTEALAATLTAYLEELGLADRGVTLVLMDDSSIRSLNRRDRGVDAATDVLSYPTSEPDDEGMPAVDHLGDILISIDTAGRQAHDHGHELSSEVLVLAAHGLTHLRGFDHPTEESWQIFGEAQRRVLQLKNAD